MTGASASRATAFGVDIESAATLRLLAGCSARATGHRLTMTVFPGPLAQLGWPSDAELVSDARQPDGRIIFQIEAHPEAGYLLHGPEYGAHLLSKDADNLICVPEGREDHAWQRLLIAQVLPFAALLHGLEVFHASAVVRDGSAVALLGPSRSGKTSLALELEATGGDFLADDVVALELNSAGLLAHPGTPIAGVSRGADPNAPVETTSESVVAGNRRERLVRLRGRGSPAPLAALFFLDRRANGPVHPEFEPDPDPRLLLSATFNFVLDSPRRLNNLLEVSAAASQLRVERILIGPDSGPAEVAAAVERRMSSAV
jgi:hypothetical protein